MLDVVSIFLYTRYVYRNIEISICWISCRKFRCVGYRIEISTYTYRKGVSASPPPCPSIHISICITLMWDTEAKVSACFDYIKISSIFFFCISISCRIRFSLTIRIHLLPFNPFNARLPIQCHPYRINLTDFSSIDLISIEFGSRSIYITSSNPILRVGEIDFFAATKNTRGVHLRRSTLYPAFSSPAWIPPHYFRPPFVSPRIFFLFLKQPKTKSATQAKETSAGQS